MVFTICPSRLRVALVLVADVPGKRTTDQLYSRPVTVQEPAVKDRGIFLNDEAPALTGSGSEKIVGNYNHQFYEKVFELLLRLISKYLWQANVETMLSNDDDPLNP